MIHGLEQSCTNRGLGGLSSLMMILQIAHTHFWDPATGMQKARKQIHDESKPTQRGKIDSIEQQDTRGQAGFLSETSPQLDSANAETQDIFFQEPEEPKLVSTVSKYANIFLIYIAKRKNDPKFN
ncbi:unnamed protein product [Protopolystoma xenopodis]|uniref:Uncharacterized protein n=1 Tax=Protopolystoma xenopodis TaxID=117903 RepID=A0A448XRS1_9PLAT|nr:unnamed protein product [Protopolystoma xenopodis]